MSSFRFTAEPIYLIFSFSFVSLATFIPQLLLYKICLQEYQHNATICNNISSNVNLQGDIQGKASFLQMLYMITTNTICFFTVLIWGPLTDVVGRRKGFLYACFALIIVYIVLLLNTYFLLLSPYYLLIAAVWTGSYGDSNGIISLSYSYIADVTEESVRTKRMAFLESFFYLGFFLGGLSCGFFIKYLGYLFVPIVNGAISLLALLYACFLMPANRNPGSLTKEESKSFDWNLVNPFHHVKKVFFVFRDQVTRITIGVMYFVYFGIMMSAAGDLYIGPFYLDYAPFNATPDVIGYYVSLTGLLAAIGAFITVFLTMKTRINDTVLLILGMLMLMVCYLVTGFARNFYVLFFGRIFQLALPLGTSISRSLTTKLAGRNADYGSILAGMECLDTLAATVASFLIGFVYKHTFQIYSGITFFVLAGTMVLLLFCFSIMWLVKRPQIQVEELLENKSD